MEPVPLPAAPHASSADVRVPWHASLRTRLMVWVGLLLALLLLAGFASAFFAARKRVIADAEARTRYEARQAADRLDATMRSVRVSGEAMIELSNRVALTLRIDTPIEVEYYNKGGILPFVLEQLLD